MWTDKIFAYCERGLNPTYWAEPFNALSNAAFMIAALAGLMTWQRWRFDLQGNARPARVELGLVALVAIIGAGSFLFHTYATRWAVVADVVPITVFMIIYLGYALRRFLGLGWVITLAGVAAFMLALRTMDMLRCEGGPCLNGSVGYLPALAVLAGIGAWLGVKGHPTARWIFGGALLFAVSLTFRTLDRAICPQTALFGGRVLGTHFIWHMCNATLLWMLLAAAIKHGGRQSQAAMQRG